MTTLEDVTATAESYGSEQFADGVASQAETISDLTGSLNKAKEDKDALDVLFANLAADYAAYRHEHPGMVTGFNISPGTSFTNTAVHETAAMQVKRRVGVYGGEHFGFSKCFYQGALPSLANPTYELLTPGQIAAVCSKNDPVAFAAGKFDAGLNSYMASIPAGWLILLTGWQEPDDEIFVKKQFTVAQYRAALQHLCDVVHKHAAYALGRVEVWPVFMEYSVTTAASATPGNGRWVDGLLTPDVDGVLWDMYLNSPKTSWNMNYERRLSALDAIHTRLGIEKRGIGETGDNPHPDGDGAARAKNWKGFYDACEDHGHSYFAYFDAIGTTGDHRLLPGTAFSDPTIAMLAAR